MEYINVILLLIFNGDRIIASHFRGGMMNFEPLDGQDLVQVTYRFSWQQSYAAEYFCNASTVAESKAINVEGMLSTVGGCADITFTPINLRCTAYSEVDDWMSGTNSLQFECNASFVDLRYSGRSWLSVQNGGSAWSLYLSATLTMRSDTNKVNTSPVSVMQPIQQLLYGCQQNITIPAVDNDGDIIRCRWSTSGVIDECGGICSKMPGITLNEGTCVLVYSPNIAPLGTYAVAVQVEDFINSNATIPMSSIPVQFLIEIAGYSTTCDKIPKVTDSNLSADNVIEIPTSSVFEDRIVAIGGNNNDRIGAIDTIGPEGMSKGALQQDPHDPTEHKWFVDVTWLPTDDQKGKHLFCFRAVNIAMVASPQTCKELLVGATTSTSSNPSENTIYDGPSIGTVKDGSATSTSSRPSERTMDEGLSTGKIIDGTGTSTSTSSEHTMDDGLSTGTMIDKTTTGISSNPSKNTNDDGLPTGSIIDGTATSTSTTASKNTMDDGLSTGTIIDKTTTGISSNPSKNTNADGLSTVSIIDGTATSTSTTASKNTMDDGLSTGTIIAGTTTGIHSNPSKNTKDDGLTTGTIIGLDGTTTSTSSNPNVSTMIDGSSTGTIIDGTSIGSSLTPSKNTKDNRITRGRIEDEATTSTASNPSEINMNDGLSQSQGTIIAETTMGASLNPSKNTKEYNGLTTGKMKDETTFSTSSNSSKSNNDDGLSTETSIAGTTNSTSSDSENNMDSERLIIYIAIGVFASFIIIVVIITITICAIKKRRNRNSSAFSNVSLQTFQSWDTETSSTI